MRALRGMALVWTVFLLTAGCTGETDDAEGDGTRASTGIREVPPTAYGAAERGWLAALGAWRETTDATLWELTVAETDDDLMSLLGRGNEEATSYVRSLLEGLHRCSETFHAEVGVSPTQRLKPGAEEILAACEDLERGAQESLVDLESGTVDPFRDAGFWIAAGRNRLWTSNRRILLRADGRRLILRGVPGESEVDVGLSDATNKIVDLRQIQLQVRCWSEGDWPEVVEEVSAFTGGGVTTETLAWASYSVGVHVSPAACATLNEFEAGEGMIDEESARTLVAFARELGVFYGVRNEASAECWGMQVADDVARALGVSQADARTLGRIYWESVFPQLPVDLRSPECRSNGQLDLDPEQRAWP